MANTTERQMEDGDLMQKLATTNNENGFDKIPAELKAMNNWVLWKLEKVNGRDTKIPYQTNGKKASSTNPQQWSSFSEAASTYQGAQKRYSGIGFVFDGSGITGIDLDHVVVDGEISESAQKVIDTFDSYTEFSQSGEGIHILVKGSIPENIKTKEIEIYSNKRYFAITGDAIHTGLHDRQEQLDIYFETYKGTKTAPPELQLVKGGQQIDPFDMVGWDELTPDFGGSTLTDDEIIEKASSAANGHKFKDLFFNGPGSDHSGSDLALCNLLAFYTRKDPHQMDSLFRRSALYRSKWDDLHDPTNNRTYGQMTIDKAIEATVEVYGRMSKPIKSPAEGTSYEDIPYFEQGNRYWKEVVKKNGEVTCVPISNFILRPIRDVEIMETGQIITECIAQNVYRQTKEVLIEPTHFNTGIKFNEAISSKDMRFNGSLTDLQFIKSLLANKSVPKVVGTKTNGFHRVDGKLVYIDSAGILGGDHDSLVSMATSPFESSITNEEPISKEEMLYLLPSLLNFNTITNTTSIIGWSCATYLKEQFKENKVKFPHLFISGTAGSGKSETITNVISPILGILSSPINANDNTKYALGVISNASNHIPILLEEYKPKKMDKWKVQGISDIMRNTYDSHLSVRGMPSIRGKTEVLELHAPLLICGEEMTEEKANLERTIFCTFGREGSQLHTQWFLHLKQSAPLLRKMGRSLLDQAMTTTKNKLMANYNKAYNLEAMGRIKSSRTRSNVAVTICGLYLLGDVVNSLGIQSDISSNAENIILNAEQEEKENGAGLNDVDETLNTMSFVCGILPGLINRAMCDPVYINANGDLLYLRVKEVYAATSKYLKENGLENNLMSLTQFEKLVKREKIFDSNRKVINTKHGDVYKTQKALSLKIQAMEDRNIEIAGFVRADQYYKSSIHDLFDDN